MAQIKQIPGFPDYQVDDEGKVFSRKVYGSKIGRLGPWWEMRPKGLSRGKHIYVDLFCEVGKPKRMFIHQLVMIAFVGPCPKGQEVRHLDDNPQNNCLSNLEYGTKRQQMEDAIRNGKLPVGEDSWLATLTNEQVREIRRLASSGMRHGEIGKKFGKGRKYITRIACREIWKHVT